MAPQKAVVVSGNAVLTMIRHLLADPEAHFRDLGPDYYDSRINKDRKVRNLAGISTKSIAQSSAA